jgi:hypothetical protein
MEAKKFWIILKAAIRIRMRIKKSGSLVKAYKIVDKKGISISDAMMKTRFESQIRYSLNTGIGVFVKDQIREGARGVVC